MVVRLSSHDEASLSMKHTLIFSSEVTKLFRAAYCESSERFIVAGSGYKLTAVDLVKKRKVEFRLLVSFFSP